MEKEIYCNNNNVKNYYLNLRMNWQSTVFFLLEKSLNNKNNLLINSVKSECN